MPANATLDGAETKKEHVGEDLQMSDVDRGYVARTIEKLQSHRSDFLVHRNQLFTQSQGVVSPAIPAAEASLLSQQDCRYLCARLGGFMVRWTSGFSQENRPSEWYSVICRRFVPMDQLTQSKRYKINRSLKHFDVRQVPAEDLAVAGYAVFIEACKRYKGTRIAIPTEEEFKRNVARESRFPDLVHNWGVYLKGSARLVGYAQNQIFDTVEANYSAIKLDPAVFENRPGFALVYKMNEYYLGNRQFQYVNDGFRSIYHQTHFQETLISALGFEKAYTRLSLYYRPGLRLLVGVAFPFRRILGSLDRRLAALLEQERCRRCS